MSTVSPAPGTGPAPLFQLAAVLQLLLPAVQVSVAPWASGVHCTQATDAARIMAEYRRRRWRLGFAGNLPFRKSNCLCRMDLPSFSNGTMGKTRFRGLHAKHRVDPDLPATNLNLCSANASKNIELEYCWGGPPLRWNSGGICPVAHPTPKCPIPGGGGGGTHAVFERNLKTENPRKGLINRQFTIPNINLTTSDLQERNLEFPRRH